MKKVLYILFHRSVLVALSLLAQVVTLVVMVNIFSEYINSFYWCCIAISVIAALLILGSRIEPAYKIAWLLLILPFPVFGGIFYLLVGGGHIPKRISRRMRRVSEQSEENLREDFKADDLLPLGEDAAGQARYLERFAHCPAYTNTETEYFALGDLVFPRMLEELKKAERYIFLEYFILQPGVFWDSILDILEEKAAQGVEVRLIYDDMGCIFSLPRDYNEQLAARGIQCRVFNRFVPIMSLRLNNRDHRKLMIIDGKVGFTGGINLADEYINRRERFGHWKDSAILLEGDAVWSMTVMFLTMWDHCCGWEEEFRHFRPEPSAVRPWTGYVQPYTDTPLDRETVARLTRQKAEGTPPVRQAIQKDTRVMLGDPAEYPERMVEAICSAARELPAVKALYLRLMVQEGEMEPSYLVVVDQEGEQDAVFSAIAGAARPWLEGKTVDLVPRSSRFGQDASKGVSPFYDRI